MEKIVHAELYVNNEDSLIYQKIKDFSSCVRNSYNRFYKNKMTFNEVRKHEKIIYTNLNTRQISDAVNVGKQLYTRYGEQKIIFGKKYNFKKLKNHTMTNEEWKTIRDNQIYSRGDVSKSGNPNSRIIPFDNNKFQLRLTVGTRKYESYDLFIPEKFIKDIQWILDSGIAYNVRIMQKSPDKFDVNIDYKIESCPIQKDFYGNGMIGIDSNPDRIAIADVSQDGNLISTETIVDNKLFYSKLSKRDYCIDLAVQQIIDKAIELKKPIAVENLNFKKDEVPKKKKNNNNNGKKKKTGKKGRNWNRTKSNFSYRKFLTKLEYACQKHGIPFIKVNPAFTSVIGKNKYQEMYRLSVHEAAAYTIGRRALGYSEKVSLYSYSDYIVKSIISRTLEEKYGYRRFHNWRYWGVLKDKKKVVLTGLRRRMTDAPDSIRSQEHTVGKADSPPISANWVKTPDN